MASSETTQTRGAKSSTETPNPENKKPAQLPCRVLFACTLCPARFPSVPVLYTHYRASHKSPRKAEVDGNSPGASVDVGKNVGVGNEDGGRSSASCETEDAGRKRKKFDGEEDSSHSEESGDVSEKSGSEEDGGVRKKRKDLSLDKNRDEQTQQSEHNVSERKDDGDDDNDVDDEEDVNVREKLRGSSGHPEGGKLNEGKIDKDRTSTLEERASEIDKAATDAKVNNETRGSSKAPVEGRASESEKAKADADMDDKTCESGTRTAAAAEKTESILLEKRQAPLVMLKEHNKPTLLVILQDMRNSQPLPEGSTFYLKNSAGKQQKHVVVANVDVEIREERI